MQQFRRKFKKTLKLVREPAFRDGMRKGVAAAIEHTNMVNRHPFGALIDIGANRGQFSLLARGLMPNAIIHAFEPLSSAGAIYSRVFEGDDQVTLHRMAAGSEASETQINITAKSDSSSLMPITGLQDVFTSDENKQIGQETVRVDRVDVELADVDLPGPVFCKIDVQGFELEAIKGCEALLDKIDVFYVECCMYELYDGQPTPFEVMQHLDSVGYEFKRIGHVSGTPHEPGCIADLLFVKKA